jgi:hypothetical protein
MRIKEMLDAVEAGECLWLGTWEVDIRLALRELLVHRVAKELKQLLQESQSGK